MRKILTCCMVGERWAKDFGLMTKGLTRSEDVHLD